MSLMFDNDKLAPRTARRGQRLTALAAVTLLALSWSLLSSLSAEAGRPAQSMSWVFGPAPAAAPND
jgi:hypothetical protein